MAQIIPLRHSSIALDPESINNVSLALENAWAVIQSSGNKLAGPAYANAIREQIAKHLLGMIESGESNQIILSESAVQYISTHYRY